MSRCLSHYLPIAWSVVSLFAITASAQNITIEKWGEPKIESFDPRHPPTDLPKLSAQEPALAAAGPRIEWSAQPARGNWDIKSHTLTLTTSGEVSFKGYSYLELPDGISDQLKAHEMGHDRLNAAEWDRIAQPIVRARLIALVGKKYAGVGQDDTARRTDAWKKADAARDQAMIAAVADMVGQMDMLSVRFDFFTDHGRSRTVSTDKGVELVLKERDNKLEKTNAKR